MSFVNNDFSLFGKWLMQFLDAKFMEKKDDRNSSVNSFTCDLIQSDCIFSINDCNAVSSIAELSNDSVRFPVTTQSAPD